jgi:hypothetical protein
MFFCFFWKKKSTLFPKIQLTVMAAATLINPAVVIPVQVIHSLAKEIRVSLVLSSLPLFFTSSRSTVIHLAHGRHAPAHLTTTPALS